MSEEEKEVLEDASTQEEIQEEQSQESSEDVDWKAKAEAAEEEANKWKETADNYRTEIETKGLRKKDRVVESTQVEEETTENVTRETSQEGGKIRNDYLSKRQDVLDEYHTEFSELDDPEWNKIKGLLTPALDDVFASASKEKRFVAKGELTRKVKDLVEYAKSGKQNKKALEEARIRGVREQEQAEDAEISSVKSKIKAKGSYSDEVRAYAEERGWDLKTADDILKKRKERDQEYAVKNRI